MKVVNPGVNYPKTGSTTQKLGLATKKKLPKIGINYPKTGSTTKNEFNKVPATILTVQTLAIIINPLNLVFISFRPGILAVSLHWHSNFPSSGVRHSHSIQ